MDLTFPIHAKRVGEYFEGNFNLIFFVRLGFFYHDDDDDDWNMERFLL